MLATNQAVRADTLSFSSRMTVAAVSALSGVFLLYFVGFANSELLHNAAHDTRHAIVTPCH